VYGVQWTHLVEANTKAAVSPLILSYGRASHRRRKTTTFFFPDSASHSLGSVRPTAVKKVANRIMLWFGTARQEMALER
jgi:hypothetical protein